MIACSHSVSADSIISLLPFFLDTNTFWKVHQISRSAKRQLIYNADNRQKRCSRGASSTKIKCCQFSGNRFIGVTLSLFLQGTDRLHTLKYGSAVKVLFSFDKVVLFAFRIRSI
jgi:hypothetical protein